MRGEFGGRDGFVLGWDVGARRGPGAELGRERLVDRWVWRG